MENTTWVVFVLFLFGRRKQKGGGHEEEEKGGGINDIINAQLKCSNETDLKWSVQVKNEDNFKGMSMYSTAF